MSHPAIKRYSLPLTIIMALGQMSTSSAQATETQVAPPLPAGEAPPASPRADPVTRGLSFSR